MDPIVLASATALVAAMATDAWQQARIAIAGLWHRVHPDQVATIEAELVQTRQDMLVAREAGDDMTEQAMVGWWQVRLLRLLRDDPALMAELQRVLIQEVAPITGAVERNRIGSIAFNSTVTDRARVYQAGHDLHINSDQP